jgi:hypothetical protein
MNVKEPATLQVFSKHKTNRKGAEKSAPFYLPL